MGIEAHEDYRDSHLFNSPIEIGLRALFILKQFYPAGLSIDRLVYLDYFLIHAGDVSKKQKSIHPKYPFRTTEIVIKRELLMNGLKLMIGKELITASFSADGIEYGITLMGIKALDYFESEYATQLIEASEWLFENYGSVSEATLKELIDTNIQKWGGEFTNESKFRG